MYCVFKCMLEWFPLGLAALTALTCVFFAIKWKMFFKRYLFAAAASVLFVIGQIHWMHYNMWSHIDPHQPLIRLVWDTLETLLLIVIILLAKIPKDIGFK